MYTLCRKRSAFTYSYSKDKKEYQMVLLHTDGLSFLPYPGGVDEQPVRLLAFFESFLAGDEHAFFQKMQKA